MNIPTENEIKNAIAKRHGIERQEKFSSAAVAICGLGGLGSNIAVSLARAGVGKLILIDFDCVDISNLNRQQYKASQIGIKKTMALYFNLKEIAPYIDIRLHDVFLTAENAYEYLNDADIICEAFDKAESKAELVNTVLEKMPDKYIVAASGMAGIGSANSITTKKITKKFYISGDNVSDVETEGCLFSSRVMLCAAHEAHMVLRILSGEYDE